MIVLALVVACGGSPTPTGEVILDHDTGSHIPEDVRARVADAATTDHTHVVELGEANEATVTLHVTTVTDPESGGRYITRIRAEVRENESYALSGRGIGNPVNMGTVEEPIMELPVRLRYDRQQACGESWGEVSVSVSANGRVEST